MYIQCVTKLLLVLVFAIFAIFPAIHKNKVPQIKITSKDFSRPNLLHSKYSLTYKSATQKYGKKSCLFNRNLSLSFRNKTVYDEILFSV